MRKTTLALCGILVLSTIGAARVAMTQEDRTRPAGALEAKQKPAVNEGETRRFFPDLDPVSPPGSSKPPARDDSGGGSGYPSASGGIPRREGGYLAGVSGPSGMSRGPATNPGAYRQRHITRTIVESYMEPIPAEELAKTKELQDAIQSLKTSTDEVARKKATEFIQQQLASQFEDDLKQREKELAEVEQRVTRLREQLDKRKVAQKAIIDLRLQTIVNDADGLGFPDMNVGGTNLSVPPGNAPLYVPGVDVLQRSQPTIGPPTNEPARN